MLAQYDGCTESLGEIVGHLRAGRIDELETLLAKARAARLRLTDETNE